MITKASQSRSNDVLNAMLLVELRRSVAQFTKVMEKRSIIWGLTERDLSTIRELRSYLDGLIEVANPSETEAKTDLYSKFLVRYPDPTFRPPWDGETLDWWYSNDGKWLKFEHQ